MKKIKQIMLIVFLLGFSTQVMAASDAAVDIRLDVDNAAVYDSVSSGIITIPEPIEVTIIKKKIAEKDKVDVVQQKWWENVLYNVLFKGLLPIILSLLSALFFLLMRKIGLKVQLQTLDGIAAQAAIYSEKKAAEWLKEEGVKSNAAMKSEWAWQLIESIDDKLVGSLTAKKTLRRLILSKIPEAEEQISLAETAKLELKEKQENNTKLNLEERNNIT